MSICLVAVIRQCLWSTLSFGTYSLRRSREIYTMNYHRPSFGWNHRIPKRNITTNNVPPRTIPTMEQLLHEYQSETKPLFYEFKLKELDKPGMAVWHFKSICSLLAEQSRKGLNSHIFRPPTYDYSESPFGWRCKLTVFHPYTTYFLVTQSTKKKAEEHACKQALIWFRDQDVM